MRKNISPELTPGCREGPIGQLQALRLTFDKSLPDLLRIARSKGLTAEAAEDIVFNAFFSLRKKIKNRTWECNCKGSNCDPEIMSKYLYTTVSHRAKGFFLTREEKGRLDVDAENLEYLSDTRQSAPSAEDQFTEEIEACDEEQLVIDIMIESFKQISTEYREILIQQYASQESLSAFSARTKRKKAHLYVLRTRAKNALAKAVKQEMKTKNISHLRYNPDNQSKD